MLRLERISGAASTSSTISWNPQNERIGTCFVCCYFPSLSLFVAVIIVVVVAVMTRALLLFNSCLPNCCFYYEYCPSVAVKGCAYDTWRVSNSSTEEKNNKNNNNNTERKARNKLAKSMRKIATRANN